MLVPVKLSHSVPTQDLAFMSIPVHSNYEVWGSGGTASSFFISALDGGEWSA
jgi:hypothetical protein